MFRGDQRLDVEVIEWHPIKTPYGAARLHQEVLVDQENPYIHICIYGHPQGRAKRGCGAVLVCL